MKILIEIKSSRWVKIALFYTVACLLTFLSLQFPDILKLISAYLLSFTLPFNWNYGLALLLSSLLFYRLYKQPRRTTLFGTRPVRSLLFCFVFLAAYSIAGISNKFGVNEHLWGFIFCGLTLIYDLFEESAWRGFLNDYLGKTRFWVKAIITGILWGAWHLLIFKNFDSFGGFHVFLLLTIIASFLIGYATIKTNSVLVAASVHGLLILKDMHVTVICLGIWTVMVLCWNLKELKMPKYILRGRQS